MPDPLAALRKLADEMRETPFANDWIERIDSALRLLGDGEVGDVPKVVQTAPKRIWLQVSDDAMDADKLFSERDETTWCQDSVMACEVPYVRADLASPVPPAVVVPDGMALVPIEPTYAMVQAGAKLVKENLPFHTGTLAIYKAMLNARPERTNG